MSCPQFNLLRNIKNFARFHSIAESGPIKLPDNSILWLRVATWKASSYYHLSKVKGYEPDVYN